jgi:hypothetical protein
MRSAAIVQNLNLLDRDYRRVSPAFVEAFFASNDDPQAFVAAEIEVRGSGHEIINGFVVVGTDELKFGRGLDAERAANKPFALDNAFGRRFVVGYRSGIG